MIHVRTPLTIDARPMADLLNAIILEGGTTALTRPVTEHDITEWMQYAPEHSVWHVALNDQDAVVGFQWIEPADDLPADAVNIATFVHLGHSGLGIGSALFNATRKQARTKGYRWINANIRSDNHGGLIYYQSRGFEDYGVLKGVTLANGDVVDKRLKRFNL
ncbi:MAG: L-amino acid N-acyltransferase YncA [Sulfitobacter sp.]|jgi:L-amino acid N-acyltransferase YncA